MIFRKSTVLHLAAAMAAASMCMPTADAVCIGINCDDADVDADAFVEEEEASTELNAELDPTKTDPEWPGLLPSSQSQFARVAINVRYDDYPEETSWFLEQWVESEPSSSSSSNSTSDSESIVAAVIAKNMDGTNGDTALLNGEWVIVDSYNGTNEDDGGRTLTSSSSQASSFETMWRFSITDDFDDGLCCEYGSGWVTITNSTGVLWSLPGHHFQDSAAIYFWMDADGNTQVVDIDEDEEMDFPGLLDKSMLKADFPWLPNYTVEALISVYGGNSSPQYKGLAWLLEHPDYTEMLDWRKEQVFSLATFLYAVGGPKWLSYNQSECNWAFRETFDDDLRASRCNVKGQLLELDDFEIYEFYGSIPPELGMLTSLTSIFLSNNYLSSTLPSEMFTLPDLKEFWISYNELHGSIPTEIGLLTSLASLSFNGNAFSGSIPDEVANMSSLHYAYFDDNSFDGKVSTEVCKLDLSWINVDCFRVSCPCESCRC